eukprot:scaffold5793_cov105-Isochrysis_galbana.AAC.1
MRGFIYDSSLANANTASYAQKRRTHASLPPNEKKSPRWEGWEGAQGLARAASTRTTTIYQSEAQAAFMASQHSTARLVAARVHVHGELDQPVGVAPLVVVPRDELDEGVVKADAGLGVESGRGGVRDEVVGDDLLVGVGHDALVLGLLAALLDELADLGVRGRLAKHAGQVDDRHIRGRHTESHAGELAVERRDDLADRLGGAGGRGDDVLARAAAAAPVLARRAVDGLLGRGSGVDGGHEALDDAVLIVDDLGERRQAVGGARGVGEDVDVLGVAGVVHAHHEHGGIRRRGRDDDLLGAALQVHRGLLDDSEDAGRLANNVGACLTPRHLVGVTARVELDLLAIDNERRACSVKGDGALVPAVGRVVLEEVGSLADGREGGGRRSQ